MLSNRSSRIILGPARAATTTSLRNSSSSSTRPIINISHPVLVPGRDLLQVKELLHLLDQQAIPGDRATYAHLLQVCGRINALPWGKRVHAHIVRSGLDGETFLANFLISMYGKCGSVEDARKIFDKIQQGDVYSWTSIIAAYAHHGEAKEALQLFQRMQLQGVKPNERTFATVLSACASLEALVEGKMIHCQVVQGGFESNFFVSNALVNMYGKCGKVEDAQRIFDRMHRRNVVSWNSIISAYAKHGQCKEALQLFKQMQLEGVKPCKITFICLLAACSRQATPAAGKMIHARIVDSGFESDVAVGTALVSMYAKCGRVEDARRIFDRMHHRNVAWWTAMITAYAHHGQGKEALQLFERMQLEGVKPNEYTYCSVLSACAGPTTLVDIKMIHARVVESGFESNVFVGTALLNMYAKCGRVEEARRIFDRIHQQNVVIWNAMIAAYAQHGQGEEAFRLFQRMQLEGVKPDAFTFSSVLSVCASMAALAEGKMVHTLILESGLESHVFVGTALVDMYAKCGSMEDAQRIFDRMHHRNEVTWNVMISAYAQHRQSKEALQILRRMQLEGVKPKKSTFVRVLSACASPAALAEGKMIHASIIESGFMLDDVLQNALVNMYAKCGSVEDAQ